MGSCQHGCALAYWVGAFLRRNPRLMALSPSLVGGKMLPLCNWLAGPSRAEVKWVRVHHFPSRDRLQERKGLSQLLVCVPPVWRSMREFKMALVSAQDCVSLRSTAPNKGHVFCTWHCRDWVRCARARADLGQKPRSGEWWKQMTYYENVSVVRDVERHFVLRWWEFRFLKTRSCHMSLAA